MASIQKAEKSLRQAKAHIKKWEKYCKYEGAITRCEDMLADFDGLDGRLAEVKETIQWDIDDMDEDDWGHCCV
jgi:hypothetical protein